MGLQDPCGPVVLLNAIFKQKVGPFIRRDDGGELFLTNSDPTMFAPLNAYYHYPPNVYYAQCTAQCILCSMHIIIIHPMHIMLNAYYHYPPNATECCFRQKENPGGTGSGPMDRSCGGGSRVLRFFSFVFDTDVVALRDLILVALGTGDIGNMF